MTHYQQARLHVKINVSVAKLLAFYLRPLVDNQIPELFIVYILV